MMSLPGRFQRSIRAFVDRKRPLVRPGSRSQPRKLRFAVQDQADRPLSCICLGGFAKSSDAETASFLVSAIQISAERPWPGVQALRHFVQDVGGLVHPAALLAGDGHSSPAPPRTRSRSANAMCGPCRPPTVHNEQHIIAILFQPWRVAFAGADMRLPAIRRRADDDQQSESCSNWPAFIAKFLSVLGQRNPTQRSIQLNRCPKSEQHSESIIPPPRCRALSGHEDNS